MAVRESAFAIWFRTRTGTHLIDALDKCAGDVEVWDWGLDLYADVCIQTDTPGHSFGIPGIPVLISDSGGVATVTEWTPEDSSDAPKPRQKTSEIDPPPQT